MLTWLKLAEYCRAAADAIGVPAVVVILVIGYHVTITQAQLEVHNVRTIDAITAMQNAQTSARQEVERVLELQNTRVVGYLRAICMNTAVYDKNLMRECGKL